VNTLQRDIKKFMLLALYKASDQAINDDTLRQLVRSAFSHVAIREAELSRIITELKDSGLFVGTDHPVMGMMWNLSFTGSREAKLLQ